MVEELSNVVAGARPRFLTRGGDTEGPVWHPEGFLTFVHFRVGDLLRWDPDGRVSVVRSDTGGGNGCTLDRQGRLVMCEGENRRVTRAEHDGSITTIAQRWQGRLLNRPNDVICRSDGTIYFTDPAAWVPRDQREMDFSGVFRVTPDGETLLATDGCEYPNGLAFSPDESVLYVAITRRDEGCFGEVERGELCGHRRIRAFDVAADGSLGNNRMFADMSSVGVGGPDGLKVDTDGRVYCTGAGGIWVFAPSGVRIGVIPVPEAPRNMAFGGEDFDTLYVTAGESVYSIATRIRGIGAF